MAKASTTGGSERDEQVSRRGVLKKAGGALAAGVAGAAVGSAVVGTPAGAATDDLMYVGEPNIAGRATFVMKSLYNIALLADPESNIAVGGSSSGRAVLGTVHGAKAGVGVEGATSGHNSETAVRGDTTPGNGEGIGVHGKTRNGIGVLAEATGGHALRVRGRAVFSRSGKVTIAAGQASATVSADISSASIVLATIQGYVTGTFVQGVLLDVAHRRFVIGLNKAAPKSLTVGWFVVN
jgi:hypothetical protein